MTSSSRLPAPESEDQAAAADVIDRRGHLRDDARVAERVGPDEETEPDPARRGAPGGQRGPALEERLERVAAGRIQVVVAPQVVVPEVVDGLRGAE